MRVIALSFLLAACGGAFESELFQGENDAGLGGEAGKVATGGAAGSSGGSAGVSSGGAAGGAGLGGTAGVGAVDGGPTCTTTIVVQSAVYAENCFAPTPMPTIAQECDGKTNCIYVVNTGGKDPKGDPAPGCWKDLDVDYKCGEELKNSYTTMVHDNLEIVFGCCT